ncbi:hypothetical protein K1719_035794 [Acacia pycnantha]|nr:hypothetical protein K1719_035794 [Acacia pycnantha]
MMLKATASSMKQTVYIDSAGKLKTPKIIIKVSCDGIKVVPPSGKKPTTTSTSNAKCKVDELDCEIWKWTVDTLWQIWCCRHTGVLPKNPFSHAKNPVEDATPYVLPMKLLWRVMPLV